jgi:hypothetical protein
MRKIAEVFDSSKLSKLTRFSYSQKGGRYNPQLLHRLSNLTHLGLQNLRELHWEDLAGLTNLQSLSLHQCADIKGFERELELTNLRTFNHSLRRPAHLEFIF